MSEETTSEAPEPKESLINSVDDEGFQEMPDLPETLVEAEPKPKRRWKVPLAIAGAVAVAACVGVGVAAATGAFNAPEQPAVVQQAEDPVEAAAKLATLVTAEGWSEDSTPVIMHVQGEADGAAVDFYHALPANSEDSVEVPAGIENCQVTYTSPINPDGSIYKVPEGGQAAVLVDESTQDTALNKAELEKIPAEEVTQEQLDGILDSLAQAVEKGDSTLAGQAGKDVVETAKENAAAAPNADAEKIEEKAEAAAGQVKDEAESTVTPSGSTGSSQGASNSQGSTSSQTSSSTEPSTPAHTHNWVAQTTQQWVSNNVWVVDQAAWNEYIPGESYLQCSCGERFNTNAEWTAHNRALGFGNSHSYSVVESPGTTIHHDEIGHWEDQGHYETVVTGYTCSGCPATK